ncbi:MAG: hypothetical protein AAFX94_02580, partial [Myxococcota bacterium]
MCTPQTAQQICVNQRRDCGFLRTSDGCGGIIDVDCGDCGALVSSNCLVGPSCPAQRVVSSEGLCMAAFSLGFDGDPVEVADDCRFRTDALLRPTQQARFRENGQIEFNGLCVAAGPGESARVTQCASSPDQLFTVTDSGQILGQDGQCLRANGTSVELSPCGDSDSRWAFIPIESSTPHAVRTVYMTANDSARTDRAAVVQTALSDNQRRWASQEATWWQASNDPIVIRADTDCSELDTLSAQNRRAIFELARADQFRLNFRYVVSTECPTPGVAEAASATSTFSLWVIDRSESQLATVGMSDGAQSEVGVYGHELGHQFGLAHENCEIGGYQGGVQEE